MRLLFNHMDPPYRNYSTCFDPDSELALSYTLAHNDQFPPDLAPGSIHLWYRGTRLTSKSRGRKNRLLEERGLVAWGSPKQELFAEFPNSILSSQGVLDHQLLVSINPIVVYTTPSLFLMHEKLATLSFLRFWAAFLLRKLSPSFACRTSSPHRCNFRWLQRRQTHMVLLRLLGVQEGHI